MSQKQTYKTKQRETIINFLKTHTDGHITAADICEHAKSTGNPIGTATVYRHLEKLTSDGIVRKYYVDGIAGSCFQTVCNHGNCHTHIHFKCEDCGAMTVIECDELEHLRKHFSSEHNITIDAIKTIFYGKCTACSAKCK